MKLLLSSRIAGNFEGFDGDRVFQFDNGQVWQQAEYKYRYRYRYRPRTKIWQKSGAHYIDVDGMDQMVRVRRLR